MSEVDNKVFLNLGCGLDLRPGFVNIDIQDLPNVDKVSDVTKLDWEDNSVDFIVAQHILEYLPRRCLMPALLEWKRVLKLDSPLEIRVTDLSHLTKSLYLNDISKEMGLHHEMVISLLYGKQKNPYDIRYNGFTSDFLQGLLMGLGFTLNNVVKEDFDVIITVVKTP